MNLLIFYNQGSRPIKDPSDMGALWEGNLHFLDSSDSLPQIPVVDLCSVCFCLPVPLCVSGFTVTVVPLSSPCGTALSLAALAPSLINQSV